MYRAFRPLLLALPLAVAAHAPAAAQLMPGGEPNSPRAARSVYLAQVRNTVEGVLAEWRQAWEGSDPRALAAFYTDDAVLLRAGAEPVSGRPMVARALEAALGPVSGVQTVNLDFTASGDAAYYTGKFHRWVDAHGATRAESGTFVMVLHHVGRTWKIRSYVEMPDAVPPAAASAADAAP
ncbi:MAG TPA: nuclear transport factor 2 family protein, partial [Longimicrobium sp.]|nr:nuclear transport factor 2 family protein [Longimicrobium sp.]